MLHHLKMPPAAEGLASRLFLGPALRTQPDRRLVTLVREGYEAAFDEIVRRYGRPLARYAASIVGGRSEDVTQDAFSKALVALRHNDAEIELRPWLFRIVRNTALNDLRDSPPSPDVLAEALAGGSNPAEELERREELADLMRRLQALPEPQRAAIVMRELEGLGHEEIAAALGLTGGGARQAIYRARRALRDGAGLLLPLPLLRLLIDHGAEVAVASAGTGGAAVAAAGATAGGAGAGGAVKLGVVAAVLAGSVGAGVAVQDHRDGEAARATAAPVQSGISPSPTQPPPSASLAAMGSDDDSGPGGGDRDDGKRGEDSGSFDDSDDHGDRSGPGSGDDRDADRHHGGQGPSLHAFSHEGRGHRGDERGGRGGGDGAQDERQHGGHGGPGRSGDDGLEDDGRGRSGSGGGGENESRSGSSSGPNSGHSGSGGGDDASAPLAPTTPAPEEGSSGSSGSGNDSDGDGSGDEDHSGEDEIE